MTRYQSVRNLGRGPDGPVDVVVPDRLGGEPLARRRTPVPAGPRRRRLRDTAESLARLGHPGIATVVDLVEIDDDLVEIFTILGTDGSLAERAALGALPAAEIHDLLGALAEALAAAHGAGVTHGHVSAGNVVHRDGRTLLTDFGLHEARTGRPEADPLRRDVVDLADLGTSLLALHDSSPLAASLRPLLAWAASDPSATLADLRAGLDRLAEPARAPEIGSGPRERPHAGRSVGQNGSPGRPTVPPAPPGARLLAASIALVVGLLLGAAFVLVPGGPGSAGAEVPVVEP